ncbi:MAG: HAD family hydrolase [Eubacteriales bacterium]
MIKLLITDVDGTLVKESHNNLNPEYFTVITQLKAKGIQVVAASGRPLSSMERIFAPVASDIWFISDCGVTVKTGDQIVNHGIIPEDWRRELWHDISQVPTADGMLCGAEQIYIPKKDSPMCKIVRDQYEMSICYQNGWEDFPEEPCGKLSLFCPENVEALGRQYLWEKWQDRLHLVISGEWWLDFTMPHVNKGYALEQLLQEHGYTPEEVLATGDNMNDIEMLTVAGTALAVSTAREEVKAVADRVIGSYEEDAVLEEWKKLL